MCGLKITTSNCDNNCYCDKDNSDYFLSLLNSYNANDEYKKYNNLNPGGNCPYVQCFKVKQGEYTLPIPPMPQIPPPLVPILSEGQFRSTKGALLKNDDPYEFNTTVIREDEIKHADGTIDILLAPNTTYEFAWSADSISRSTMYVSIGAKLTLNGVVIPGSYCSIQGVGGTVINTQACGGFITGENTGVINLVFESGSEQSIESNAVLRILALKC